LCSSRTLTYILLITWTSLIGSSFSLSTVSSFTPCKSIGCFSTLFGLFVLCFFGLALS
jgi:hypothetical protein